MKTKWNRNSIRTRFAFRFIRAINKLKKPSSSSETITSNRAGEKYKKYCVIRDASYTSMAYSVGPRRAWARAILLRIRNRRRRNHKHLVKGIRKVREEEGVSEQENHLRQLVPGGEEMDFCCLLNETGHYIQCLRTQQDLGRQRRRRPRVPAFGSWDLNDYNDLSFTQCFDTAKEGRLFRYSFSEDHRDLYQNHRAFTASACRRVKVASSSSSTERVKKVGRLADERAPNRASVATRAVDTDLYIIPPELLRAHNKRKKVWGFFSSCILPAWGP